MRSPTRFWILLARPAASVAVLATLFLTGCSTVKTRIAENPPAFYSLRPDDQALVQSGRIREGLPREAVYVAWGTPNTIRQIEVEGKASETWVYYGTDSYPVESYSFWPYRAGRYRYYQPYYDPMYVSYRYYLKSVTFVKNRVVAWDAPVFL